MKMADIGDLQQYADYLDKNTVSIWVVITPDVAKEMLEHNTDNYRKCSKMTVRKYKMDIENGDWEVNGDTIVFDNKGVLKNGQHRLHAVIESGKPIISLVVYDIPSTNQYDTFRKRSEIEIIRAEGLKSNDNSIIAAVKILIRGFAAGGNNMVPLGETKAVITVFDNHLHDISNITQHGRKNSRSYRANRASVIAAIFAKTTEKKIHLEEIDPLFRIVNSQIADENAEVNSNAGLYLAAALNRKANDPAHTDAMHFDATCQAIEEFLNNKRRKDPYRSAISGQWLTRASQRTYDVAHQTVIAKLDEYRRKG